MAIISKKVRKNSTIVLWVILCSVLGVLLIRYPLEMMAMFFCGLLILCLYKVSFTKANCTQEEARACIIITWVLSPVVLYANLLLLMDWNQDLVGLLFNKLSHAEVYVVFADTLGMLLLLVSLSVYTGWDD